MPSLTIQQRASIILPTGKVLNYTVASGSFSLRRYKASTPLDVLEDSQTVTASASYGPFFADERIELAMISGDSSYVVADYPGQAAAAPGGAVTSVNGQGGAVVITAASIGAAVRLAPTAIQTTAAPIAAGSLAIYDTTAGPLSVALPTDPPDGTLVGVRHATGAPNNLTVTAGGTNKIGTGTATSTTVPVNVETSTYQFVTALNAWLTISNFLPPVFTPLAVASSRTLTLGDRANTLSLATGLTMTLPAAGTLGAGYGNGFRLPPSGTMTLSWPTGVTVNGVAGPSTATRTRSGGTNVQVFITPTETADNFDFSGV